MLQKGRCVTGELGPPARAARSRGGGGREHQGGRFLLQKVKARQLGSLPWVQALQTAPNHILVQECGPFPGNPFSPPTR